MRHAMLEAIAAAMAADEEGEASTNSVLPEARAEDLRDRFARYQVRHEFRVGDLVRQKQGLDAYKWPCGDHPAIVTSLDVPIEVGGGISGDLEKSLMRADMVVAVIAEDGNWLEFAVDGRRFEPWTPPAPKAEG